MIEVSPMNKKVIALVLIVSMMLLGTLTIFAAEPVQVNISAAASLKDALLEIQKYTKPNNRRLNSFIILDPRVNYKLRLSKALRPIFLFRQPLSKWMRWKKKV